VSKLHPFWKLKAPLLACPEGEQAVNGGFTTGDFTGWTIGSGAITPVISETYQTYPYSARWTCPTGLPSGWKYGKMLLQTFDPPIDVRCITECSIWFAHSGLLYVKGCLQVIYSDSYILDKEYQHDVGWYIIDILALLDPTKKVSSIAFFPQLLYEGEYMHVDTFTCMSHQP
jgi:hypothetical protein